jgi:AMP nucleosidase
MEHRIFPKPISTIVTPDPFARQSFADPAEAVAALKKLYERNTSFLRDSFLKLADGGQDNVRYRAYYPEVGVSTSTYAQVDTRVSYGHVPAPGQYATTITRPDLFESYLIEQLRLLIRNHGVPITVAESSTPIPLHFAFGEGTYVEASIAERIKRPLRDVFDVPDLNGTDDHIANGTFEPVPGEPLPLAVFTAQRIE